MFALGSTTAFTVATLSDALEVGGSNGTDHRAELLQGMLLLSSTMTTLHLSLVADALSRRCQLRSC